MNLDEIKRGAGDISKAYLLHGANMTEAVYAMAREQNLNPEQIRRLCEIANQNTYLELFQDKAGRGNIVFDTAKSEDIIKQVEDHKVNELDYKLAPEDFRKQAALTPETNTESTTKTTGDEAAVNKTDVPEQSAAEKAMSMKKRTQLRSRLQTMASSVATMKSDEAAAVEDAVDKVAELCRDICSNGESFADMAKLAMRHGLSSGYDMNRTTTVLGKVADYISSRGFKISHELTKVSEMAINPDFKLFKIMDEYHMAMNKFAALREMETNVDAVLKTFESQPLQFHLLEDAVKK